MVSGLGAQNINSQESLEEIERRILSRLRRIEPERFQHLNLENHQNAEASSHHQSYGSERENFPAPLDAEQEDKVTKLERIVLKRSVFSLRSEMMLFAALGGTNLMFNSLQWPGFLIKTSIPVSQSAFYIEFPWAIVVMAFLAVRIYFKQGDNLYTLGRRHLRAISGNYGLKRNEVEIPYESILFVEVNQNLIDRVFRVGTIQAGRNTETKSEIVMRGVRYPHRWVKVIKKRMNMAKGVADREEYLD